MDFQNKRVTVMGLGLYEKGSGIESVKFFLRCGAKVTVTDLRSAKELEGSVRELVRYYSRLPKMHNPSQPPLNLRGGDRSSPPLKVRGAGGVMNQKLAFILGKHREEDFKNADVVFQNPSVPAESPYLKIAAKRGVPIVNDWSLFLSRHTPKIFIGITGTRGKSTTTAMVHEMMKRQYHSPSRTTVRLAGNLGVSPLAFIDEYKGEPIVAELSSWLLHHFPTVKKSPNIAVVTNIMNDHLDKYRNARDYITDKENVFRFQDAKGVVILNYDNPITRGMAKRARGKVVWFSAEKGLPRWVPLDVLQLPGVHNRANALAAALAAEAAGVTRRDIEYVMKNFRGLPNRLELVRTVEGVKYYNDTTATTPDATIAALRTIGNDNGVRPKGRLTKLSLGLHRHIILIAGGADKKLEYREMAKCIKEYCKAVVLLPGTATAKVHRECRMQNAECRMVDTRSMREAVKNACTLAKEGDVVLLSPGAASFGIFKNEFDRGKQFVDAVKRL